MRWQIGFWRMAAAVVLTACLLAACGKSPGKVSGKGESLQLVEGGGMEYKNEKLGFAVGLPELFVDHLTVVSESRQAYGEEIHLIRMEYEGEESSTTVLSLVEMSKEVWELSKKEEGPQGTQLGESQEGRVVIFNSLQSNPFPEGSEDFARFQEYPQQLAAALENFYFLEE